MRSLALTGVALATLMVSQPLRAAVDSGAPIVPVSLGNSQSRSLARDPMGNIETRNPAPVLNGNTETRSAIRPARRLMALQQRGWDGWSERASYGFQLPREWMSPEYYISDYDVYGLDRPARGFGWSHYQDDLVLTDQWGRVYDVRPGDNDGRGYGHRHRHGFGGNDTDGLAGGVAGSAVGAVAGNVIAGTGSRLAGSLIGGGVGALAGVALEAALSKHHGHGHHHGDDHVYDEYRGAHWGGYSSQSWSYGGCGCGGETVTTTTVTENGGGYMVPRRTVWYENVYEAAPAKYRLRATAPAPTKYHERAAAAPAPAPADGKVHERTRLHTKTIKR